MKDFPISDTALAVGRLFFESEAFRNLATMMRPVVEAMQPMIATLSEPNPWVERNTAWREMPSLLHSSRPGQA